MKLIKIFILNGFELFTILFKGEFYSRVIRGTVEVFLNKKIYIMHVYK